MSEQPPSKDGVSGRTVSVWELPSRPLPPRELKTYTFEELRETFDPGDLVLMLIDEIERLREELQREVGTRAARVAEIDHLRRQVAELSVHAEKWVKRALTPAHEREGSHCSTCGCGLAPEPAVTLAFLRQLSDEYIGTLDNYPLAGYATPQEYAGSELSRFFAWLEMSSGFAVRATQPPRDGQCG